MTSLTNCIVVGVVNSTYNFEHWIDSQIILSIWQLPITKILISSLWIGFVMQKLWEVKVKSPFLFNAFKVLKRPKLRLCKQKKEKKKHIWAKFIHFHLIMSKVALSKINLLFKCISQISLTRWCCWRFKFKYAPWVPLGCNTYIVFQTSMSSMRFSLLSPWHKIMYIINKVSHTHTHTHIMNLVKPL